MSILSVVPQAAYFELYNNSVHYCQESEDKAADAAISILFLCVPLATGIGCSGLELAFDSSMYHD
jgi:hypothetical protein